MVRDVAKANLNRKRFSKRRINLPKWEEGSEYGWEVVDSWGEVKPLKVIQGKDADIIIRRLHAMHKNEVKVARPEPDRTHRVCR